MPDLDMQREIVRREALLEAKRMLWALAVQAGIDGAQKDAGDLHTAANDLEHMAGSREHLNRMTERSRADVLRWVVSWLDPTLNPIELQVGAGIPAGAQLSSEAMTNAALKVQALIDDDGVDDAGHWVPRTYPDLDQETIAEFVASLVADLRAWTAGAVTPIATITDYLRGIYDLAAPQLDPATLSEVLAKIDESLDQPDSVDKPKGWGLKSARRRVETMHSLAVERIARRPK